MEAPVSAAENGILAVSLKAAGFTLLELLVVLAIVAIASAGVGFSIRDGTQTRLEREALRLAALLESARARSQVSGVAVRWRVTPEGFLFEGLPKTDTRDDELPQVWLDTDTRASVNSLSQDPLLTEDVSRSAVLLLGPEPIIAPQTLTLLSRSQPTQRLRLGTDGVRPFAVQAMP
jgi:general secretion pathway protein H